jgi:hypothetical protein
MSAAKAWQSRSATVPASIVAPSLLQTELQSEISRPMTDEEKEEAEANKNDPLFGMF